MTPTQTVQSVYDAFQRGDVPHILSLVVADVQWSQSKMLPWGGDYTNSVGVAEFFTKLAANMETTQFEPKENIEQGNDVFSFGVYGGKSLKTGKSAVANWMFRWRVVDGKIVSYNSYIDSAALLSALSYKLLVRWCG